MAEKMTWLVPILIDLHKVEIGADLATINEMK